MLKYPNILKNIQTLNYLTIFRYQKTFSYLKGMSFFILIFLFSSSLYNHLIKSK